MKSNIVQLVPKPVRSLIRKLLIGTLYSAQRKSYFCLGRREKTRSKYGFTIEHYSWDITTRLPLKIYGAYEPHISDFIYERFNKRSNILFLDVGAYIGWYTLLLNSITSDSTLVAFEPNPVMYYLLGKNVADHVKEGNTIITLPLAVSDKKGITRLYISTGKNLGDSSLHQQNTEKSDVSIPVPAISIFDALKEYLGHDTDDVGKKYDILFLKMDVEGSEPKVLRGAAKVLKAHKNVYILTEYTYSKIENMGEDPVAFLEELDRLATKRNTSKFYVFDYESEKTLNVYSEDLVNSVLAHVKGNKSNNINLFLELK